MNKYSIIFFFFSDVQAEVPLVSYVKVSKNMSLVDLWRWYPYYCLIRLILRIIELWCFSWRQSKPKNTITLFCCLTSSYQFNTDFIVAYINALSDDKDINYCIAASYAYINRSLMIFLYKYHVYYSAFYHIDTHKNRYKIT